MSIDYQEWPYRYCLQNQPHFLSYHNITTTICILLLYHPFCTRHATVSWRQWYPDISHQQNSPTTSIHHGHYLFNLKTHNLDLRLWHQISSIFHEQQVLAAVIIVSSIVLFALHSIEMHTSDVLDGRI